MTEPELRRMADWCRSPRMIGGHVSGPLVMVRTTQTIVALRQVLAFPTGIEVEVEAHGLGTWARRTASAFIEADRPRFSVRFSDERTAHEDDDLAGLRQGYGPTIVPTSSEHSGGGPDNGDDINLTLWIWPLPPPGPVRISFSWPQAHIDQVSVFLDGDEIRAAAQKAQPLFAETES